MQYDPSFHPPDRVRNHVYQLQLDQEQRRERRVLLFNGNIPKKLLLPLGYSELQSIFKFGTTVPLKLRTFPSLTHFITSHPIYFCSLKHSIAGEKKDQGTERSCFATTGVKLPGCAF